MSIRNVAHLLPNRTRAQLVASGMRLPQTHRNIRARAAGQAAAKARQRNRALRHLYVLAEQFGTEAEVYPPIVREHLRRDLNMTRPQINKLITILRRNFNVFTFHPGPGGRNVNFIRMLVHGVKTQTPRA